MEHEHEGHRKRMRERFLKEGSEGFQPHEMLEMLLYYSIPRRNTNDYAHALIKKFGSLSGVFNATPEALMTVDGISEKSAMLISLMAPMFRIYVKDKAAKERIVGAPAVENYICSRLSGLSVETVMLVCLDNRYCMLADEFIGEGSVNSSIIDKRKAVETVLRHNATAAIVAHNHPAGFALPSQADIRSTIELKAALDTIGVRLIDHIITCPDDHISLAQSRQFASLF